MFLPHSHLNGNVPPFSARWIGCDSGDLSGHVVSGPHLAGTTSLHLRQGRDYRQAKNHRDQDKTPHLHVFVGDQESIQRPR